MNAKERFWRGVAVGDPDECWPWKGTAKKNDYGNFLFDGRLTKAHRVAWILTHGPIPAGLFVCHHCDNKPCCNPYGDKHLFLGTPADNAADMFSKDRQTKARVRGERHHKAKLTERDVLFIREKVRQGKPYARLARYLGVDSSLVRQIALGKVWRWLEDQRG